MIIITSDTVGILFLLILLILALPMAGEEVCACLARVPKDHTGARLHNVEGFPGLALAHDHLPSIEDARLQRAAQLRAL